MKYRNIIQSFLLATIAVVSINQLSYAQAKKRTVHSYDREAIEEGVKAGYRFIACKFQPTKRKSNRGSHPLITDSKNVRRPPSGIESANWAGYVGVTDLNKTKRNSVSAVYGSWKAPVVKPSPYGDTYAAIWIGIDGYDSPTVEQIGTSHDWIDGQQDHWAWFEMYPDPAQRLTNFPIKPGDIINTAVKYIGLARDGQMIFSMTIYNKTQKVFTAIPTNYTRSKIALRKSAEWIVEAPYSNEVLPLANFGTVEMYGCIAVIEKAVAGIKNPYWKSGAITMADSGIVKASCSDTFNAGKSFKVTWVKE